MSVSLELEKMIGQLQVCLADAEKHSRGVDAASARVRKQLMETKKGCDTLRKQIQDERNARKG